MIVIFDIDGTLANLDHRLHHWRETPKNWDAFKDGMKDDELIIPVFEVYHALRKDPTNKIVAVTGRGEDTRETTETWLNNHHIFFDRIYMRTAHDRRQDTVIKAELLEKLVKEFGELPTMVFDDRPSVVRTWRKLGVFCFNVYQAEEEF